MGALQQLIPWMISLNSKTSTNSSTTVDLETIKRLYPVGSRIRIVQDTLGLARAELNDTYTVIEVKRTDRLHLRDSLGNRFTWPLMDCIHPGTDMEWIQHNSPAFAEGTLTRRLLQGFSGKRFLRLRPSIRDRILLQQPDLKDRIMGLLATLNA